MLYNLQILSYNYINFTKQLEKDVENTFLFVNHKSKSSDNKNI